ncbi:glycosyltransferase [Salmonirosea aquatica]|uniref:Glycosyltransferase n=1 Tax=Salmonirosea aquatica TaxID=2654236 RepID=A0A7C9BDR4_9BACT|nr:glycosyltransferase [Cytophagaceae bacterium SJW1-29]
MSVNIPDKGRIFAKKSSFYPSSCVTEILLALLGIFVFIQLFYYLFVFSKLMRHDPPTAAYAGAPEGVSVLVCAWNELENLRELLPLLNAQEYPLFEIVVLDDRSQDGTEDFLKEHADQWRHVRFIRIDKEFPHITAKKYALTVGMKHARYPLALMTDADCRPIGTDWIASMVGQLGPDKEIVLGFSPYYKEKGLLNWFIRCETFYTAIQYLSLARAGWPYMGVGRNLMYRTRLFFEHKGFYQHKHILGGDDDLFMNQAATRTNTSINLDPESFVYSIPKTTWSDWLRQKRRHLSVGNYYQRGNKLRLGLLSGSHTGTWFVGIATLLWGLFSHDTLLLQILGAVFALRWLVQLIVLGGINSRLDRTVNWLSFIGMDIAFFIYYVGMSGLILSRKKKVLWR